MPRFLCYCPDLPNVLQLRMSVRPEHLKLAKPDQESGVMAIGEPFLPRPGTAQRENPPTDGTPNFAGAYMIFNFDTLEQVWDRLKADAYWTEGVWDKDRIIVEELFPTPK